ncbi:MAG: GGDEF domain-containing protein, partial [Rhizorhabdus sp.]
MYEGKPPSSAGRKGWSLDSLFGRGAEEGMPLPATVPGEAPGAVAEAAPANDLFSRIGGFLRAHRLDPTPV